MDTPSTFHMRESYTLKIQSHDPDTPTYMDALPGKNSEEDFKAMDDEIQSIIRWDTWEIASRKSVADQMCFQEHGLSSARGNMVGQLGNSRHVIL